MNSRTFGFAWKNESSLGRDSSRARDIRQYPVLNILAHFDFRVALRSNGFTMPVIFLSKLAISSWRAAILGFQNSFDLRKFEVNAYAKSATIVFERAFSPGANQ